MKKPELTIPTILGVLVVLAGLAVGVILLQGPLRGLVGASIEETPREVKITNVSDNSFVVSWVTDKATSGFVQYDSLGKNPSLVVSDDRDQEKGSIGNYFTHLVTIRGLKPTTKYNFRLGSGKGLYDQAGKLYEIGTGVVLLNAPAATVAYGQVLGPSGDPAEGAIVYVSLPGVVPQAGIVKSSGSWAIPISTARTSDLTSFAAYDKQNASIDMFVQGGTMGTTTLKVNITAINPVQKIVLGSAPPLVESSPLPTSLPIPTPVAQENLVSKFSAIAVSPAREATAAGQLILLTPKIGEVVNTTRPEIIGEAPAGATVTIEIHSDAAIMGTVKADKDGDFSYSVPTDLSPGEHIITITTIINGIMKKVTKTFVVEAAGESSVPAFTATPSATLKPSPTPKASPTPTPTITPRISYPATDSGTPASGNLTPTLLLLILGGGLVMSGLFVYRKV